MRSRAPAQNWHTHTQKSKNRITYGIIMMHLPSDNTVFYMLFCCCPCTVAEMLLHPTLCSTCCSAAVRVLQQKCCSIQSIKKPAWSKDLTQIYHHFLQWAIRTGLYWYIVFVTTKVQVQSQRLITKVQLHHKALTENRQSFDFHLGQNWFHCKPSLMPLL